MEKSIPLAAIGDKPIPGSQDGDATSGSPIKEQDQPRRLFSISQLFAFSLTYMSLWNSYFALYNGGPASLFFNFIIVMIGAMAQAASIGEMASMQPIAGAQYHWTWYLAPPKFRRFTTWVQGWSTWFGYISLLAGIANSSIVILESIISLNYEDYKKGGWHTSVLVIGLVFVQAVVNIYSFKLVIWFELLDGILHCVLFVVFIVVLPAIGTRNGPEFFVSTNISSGYSESPFIAWNVGMLSCVWIFTGFDSVIHMSEETRAAKQAVPRAMFWSIVMNGTMGFVIAVVFLVAMGTVEDALNAPSIVVGVLMQVTGSKSATTAMMTGIFIGAFGSNLASIASVSRLTWAWARDGGLPKYFGHVDHKTRIPLRAVVLTVFLLCSLCLLIIGSETYVVFGAIMSLSSLALYLSYAIAISSMLWSRFFKPDLEFGQWNLGRKGLFINIYALVYTLWAMVFLPFPTTIPVDATTMNHCGPMMGLVLVVAIGLWFLNARKHWAGPNVTIIDFVMRNS
ncbi:amino acid permease [Microdochium trichocladiopsis]|uniref:Amino acid permease n=1 Tax=Microdochium trichocladiopsis TaxID=1682393 RepID=A0A9P8XXV4_9PEZI|nr:amino acid permease [Microdochium trichocladiopsis]KAH7018492.1 amino acid permease [Microdochium trichocladiopsis]